MYSGLTRYPFDDPAVGGLDWHGEGRGCNTLTGWFAIDDVTYRNGNLSVIDLRFEQHCEGQSPAIHATIHWDAADPTMPQGPVNLGRTSTAPLELLMVNDSFYRTYSIDYHGGERHPVLERDPCDWAALRWEAS